MLHLDYRTICLKYSRNSAAHLSTLGLECFGQKHLIFQETDDIIPLSVSCAALPIIPSFTALCSFTLIHPLDSNIRRHKKLQQFGLNSAVFEYLAKAIKMYPYRLSLLSLEKRMGAHWPPWGLWKGCGPKHVNRFAQSNTRISPQHELIAQIAARQSSAELTLSTRFGEKSSKLGTVSSPQYLSQTNRKNLFPYKSCLA